MTPATPAAMTIPTVAMLLIEVRSMFDGLWAYQDMAGAMSLGVMEAIKVVGGHLTTCGIPQRTCDAL